MTYYNMPEGYVQGEKPWHPNSEAYDSAECVAEGCDQIEYVGTLNQNDGICSDCHNKEGDQ